MHGIYKPRTDKVRTIKHEQRKARLRRLEQRKTRREVKRTLRGAWEVAA